MKQLLSETYQAVRPAIRSGDAIFFGGNGFFSSAIRLFTGLPSHVAMVERTEDRVRLIEATSQKVNRKRIMGAQYTYLSDRLDSYNGYVWWAPLREEFSRRITSCIDEFHEFVSGLHGVRYDFWQVLRRGYQSLPLPRVIPLHECEKRLFCSELVALTYKYMGVLPEYINSSKVSPYELASFNIWIDAYLLSGKKRKSIKALNTEDVW